VIVRIGHLTWAEMAQGIDALLCELFEEEDVTPGPRLRASAPSIPGLCIVESILTPSQEVCSPAA
jgi:hypothetical protein